METMKIMNDNDKYPAIEKALDLMRHRLNLQKTKETTQELKQKISLPSNSLDGNNMNISCSIDVEVPSLQETKIDINNVGEKSTVISLEVLINMEEQDKCPPSLQTEIEINENLSEKSTRILCEILVNKDEGEVCLHKATMDKETTTTTATNTNTAAHTTTPTARRSKYIKAEELARRYVEQLKADQ